MSSSLDLLLVNFGDEKLRKTNMNLKHTKSKIYGCLKNH